MASATLQRVDSAIFQGVPDSLTEEILTIKFPWIDNFLLAIVNETESWSLLVSKKTGCSNDDDGLSLKTPRYRD